MAQKLIQAPVAKMRQPPIGGSRVTARLIGTPAFAAAFLGQGDGPASLRKTRKLL
jgi:hypothetical protein